MLTKPLEPGNWSISVNLPTSPSSEESLFMVQQWSEDSVDTWTGASSVVDWTQESQVVPLLAQVPADGGGNVTATVILPGLGRCRTLDLRDDGLLGEYENS